MELVVPDMNMSPSGSCSALKVNVNVGVVCIMMKVNIILLHALMYSIDRISWIFSCKSLVEFEQEHLWPSSEQMLVPLTLFQ